MSIAPCVFHTRTRVGMLFCKRETVRRCGFRWDSGGVYVLFRDWHLHLLFCGQNNLFNVNNAGFLSSLSVSPTKQTPTHVSMNNHRITRRVLTNACWFYEFHTHSSISIAFWGFHTIPMRGACGRFICSPFESIGFWFSREGVFVYKKVGLVMRIKRIKQLLRVCSGKLKSLTRLRLTEIPEVIFLDFRHGAQ
jgi:hypothetical protein